jgi:UDP-glucose 6-dehydrogenase
MLVDIMIKAGVEKEIDMVLSAIGGDSRVGKKYLKYGFGFGGPCLPRDNRALGHFANNLGMELNLPLTVDNFNKEHANFIKNYYVQKNPDKSVPFVMEYITYKKGTDILEESQQFQLCVDLLNEGYTLHVIEIDSITKKLQQMSESYNNRLKFFKPGTNPQGYKITL